MTITAKTTHGMVLGTYDGQAAIFRGIPYGGPCDGAHRFLPPTPPEDWEGVRDCTKNGYYAVQHGTSISGSDFFGDYFSGGNQEIFGVADEQQNENCLVLNVVTPGADDKKRPVLVYIHGGGFATGSGTLVLGAGTMAKDEDIVIVGINHRLNIFGYLYLGAFDEKYASSGMAGMLDLVLALEWVRDNIMAFGGDPAQVTIMGESGGGMKVSTLLAMPKARGLFRAAIVESGSNVVGRLSVKEAAENARKVLDCLNIPADNLDALAQLSSAEILRAMESLADQDGLRSMSPVADNINLPYQLENKFTAPEISRHIPLMVGASEDEMAVFTPMPELEHKITWENLRETLLLSKGSFNGISKMNEQNVDKIIETFKRNDTKNNTPAHLFAKISSLSGFLGGGAWYQAEAKAKQGGAPVYHYAVAYDAPMPGNPQLKYAWHTADLPLQMRVVLHPECEAISKTMSAAIAAFVRSTNPSTPELVWPEFNPDTCQVMVFDDVCRVETDPWKELRECLA